MKGAIEDGTEYDEFIRPYEEAVAAEGADAVLPMCALLRHEDPAVVVKAAGLLGAMKDPRAVPALMDALPYASHWGQHAIVVALGEIGDRRAVEPLSQFIMSSRNGDAVCKAFDTLVEWQDPRGLEAVLYFRPLYPTVLPGWCNGNIEKMETARRNSAGRCE